MDRGESILHQRIVFRARNLSEDDRHKLFEFLEVQSINEIDSELTEYEAYVNPVKIMTALHAKKNTVLEEISLFSGKNDASFLQGGKMLSEHFLASKPKSESYIEDMKPELDKPKLLTRARKLVADLNVEMMHLINNDRRQNEIFLRRHKLLLISRGAKREPADRPRKPGERLKRDLSAVRSSRNVEKADVFEKVIKAEKVETVDKVAKENVKKRKISIDDLDKVIYERDKAKTSVTQIRDKINEYKMKFKALKEHKDVEDMKYRELHERELMLLKELEEGEKKNDELKEYFKSLLTCSD